MSRICVNKDSQFRSESDKIDRLSDKPETPRCTHVFAYDGTVSHNVMGFEFDVFVSRDRREIDIA
jgi:hypothetical protein